jgi:methionyl-tRNA formyltransferase
MTNIAFFGTPEFSVPALHAVQEQCTRLGHQLALVVCQPDRPKGRGQKIEAPPVKSAAEKLNIPVLQPQTLRMNTEDGDLLYETMKNYDIGLAVVVAYGRIFTRRLLALPRLGFINTHASLLPRWRGAAPIERALLHGDATTGISIMHLVEEMDAGDVYARFPLTIAPKDNSFTLRAKLSVLAAEALKQTLPAILEESLPMTPQPSQGISYAPLLAKDEGLIDFSQRSEDVINHNRAMHGWPTAYTFYGQHRIILDGASKSQLEADSSVNPGTIVGIEHALHVATADGTVQFARIKLEGKRDMTMDELSRGFQFVVGDQLDKSKS